MFGLSKKPVDDKLTVQVHVVSSNPAFGMAQKVWGENMRSLQFNQMTGKEIMHFAYAQPKCVVWLQRDHGRTDVFELVVRWEDDDVHEVYVVSRVADGLPAIGNDHRLQELLHSILTVPSIVPSTVPTGGTA
ncbi:MAG TPA: hypothetical protein VJP80_07025 [Candidatus Saccharimonadales bacterium]|nr:hypothetical protein [Candidatus Saccharimonadales bacterium]